MSKETLTYTEQFDRESNKTTVTVERTCEKCGCRSGYCSWVIFAALMFLLVVGVAVAIAAVLAFRNEGAEIAKTCVCVIGNVAICAIICATALLLAAMICGCRFRLLKERNAQKLLEQQENANTVRALAKEFGGAAENPEKPGDQKQ